MVSGLQYSDKISCPKCDAKENMYWHGDDTTICKNCGHVGFDHEFIDIISTQQGPL